MNKGVSRLPSYSQKFSGAVKTPKAGRPLWKFVRAAQIAAADAALLRVENLPYSRADRFMLKVKDTLRATVHLSFDGRVFKTYHGPKAEERFDNEVRVLRHLAQRGCDFVPRLLEADRQQLRIVTSSCGTRVEHLDVKRTQELFAELEKFGVRHDDPDVRNVTYRFADGRFCLIDFEFATILPDAKSSSP